MQITTIYHLLKNQLSYSPREYIDVRSKSQQKLAVKYKKRQTMFDVIQKQSSKLPGPGKYVVNPQDQKLHKKIIKKINFQQQAKKPSNNYIAQELKKKKGIPGIGKYQIEHDNSQKIKLRYEVLSKKARKEAPIFRPTIFYDNQVDCINVGPGTYNTEVFKKNASLRNMPEYKPVNASDEKEKEKGKTKRSQSLPKLPTPQTYNPIPAQYNTFDAMQSRNGEEHSKSLMGKKKRFSAVRELGPGPKYSLIANWSPKNKQGKQVINIFKSTKNTKAPSVYH